MVEARSVSIASAHWWSSSGGDAVCAHRRRGGKRRTPDQRAAVEERLPNRLAALVDVVDDAHETIVRPFLRARAESAAPLGACTGCTGVLERACAAASTRRRTRSAAPSPPRQTCTLTSRTTACRPACTQVSSSLFFPLFFFSLFFCLCRGLPAARAPRTTRRGRETVGPTADTTAASQSPTPRTNRSLVPPLAVAVSRAAPHRLFSSQFEFSTTHFSALSLFFTFAGSHCARSQSLCTWTCAATCAPASQTPHRTRTSRCPPPAASPAARSPWRP